MFRRALLATALLLTVDSARASVDALATSGCAISGKVTLSTTVFSAALGGVALAQLNYVPRKFELTELPSDSSKGRAHVDARTDTPSIHVVGYAPADAFPIANKVDVTVVAGHVVIRNGSALRILQPQPGDFVVEPKFPSFAKVRGAIACSDLVLGTNYTGVPDSSPGKDYHFKTKTTALYDAPFGKSIFSLELLGTTASYVVEIHESKGAWHHFQSTGPEKIDGWLRAQDLVPLKEDEDSVFGALGGLGLSGIGGTKPAPLPMIALRDSGVFLDTAKTATVAGVLEKGAKVRALPAAPGFSLITTWDNEVSAPAGKSFYVLTADLTAAP